MDARYTFDNGETSHHSIEMIYWLKRARRIFSDLKPAFPAEPIKMHAVFEEGFEQALFGGICNGRVLIGHEKGVHEYKVIEDRWLWVNDQENKWFAKYCVTEDFIITCGGKSENCCGNALVQLLQFQKSGAHNLTKVTCPTLLPLHIDNGHVLASMGNSTVILVGGNYLGNRVFQGELTSTKNDFKWKQLEPMNIARIRPLMFKINGGIYVAGGMKLNGDRYTSCERYDMNTKEWHMCEHLLPDTLNIDNACVVVNDEEDSVIITGGTVSSEIVIFSEKGGFSIIDKGYFSTKIPFYNKRHVSILLPS